jgi:hypothetical protein
MDSKENGIRVIHEEYNISYFFEVERMPKPGMPMGRREKGIVKATGSLAALELVVNSSTCPEGLYKAVVRDFLYRGFEGQVRARYLSPVAASMREIKGGEVIFKEDGVYVDGEKVNDARPEIFEYVYAELELKFG